MGLMRNILRSLINSVTFWKDKDVPGVADTIRKTQLKQDKKARQSDMQELLRMVEEGRLHEADERQLESLKMALELSNLLGKNQEPQASVDPTQLVEAVKQAISEGMANVTVLGADGLDPSRPEMRHVSLADLTQDDTKINIAHKEGIGTEVEGIESSDKLEKLRKIKGGQ